MTRGTFIKFPNSKSPFDKWSEKHPQFQSNDDVPSPGRPAGLGPHPEGRCISPQSYLEHIRNIYESPLGPNYL